MTLRQDLIAARALVDTPEKWCHGGPSSHRNGVTSRCIFIALGDINIGPRRIAMGAALSRAIPWRFLPRVFGADCDDRRIIWLNDDKRTTHDDIMALFDRAINEAP